ncbi:MAG: hypothetical protein ACRCTP_03865 [Aeromonas popoffii]|uniref:hypothetical protein n=1 Tax=Aeromonas popoffii TaxID=70856 RepID=UPI003F2CCEA5
MNSKLKLTLLSIGLMAVSANSHAMNSAEKLIACSNLHDTMQMDAPTAEQAGEHRRVSNVAFSMAREQVGLALVIAYQTDPQLMAYKMMGFNRKEAIKMIPSVCGQVPSKIQFTAWGDRVVPQAAQQVQAPARQDTREKIVKQVASLDPYRIYDEIKAGRLAPVKYLLCSEFYPVEVRDEYRATALKVYDPNGEFEDSKDNLFGAVQGDHNYEKLLRFLMSSQKEENRFTYNYCD